MVNVLRGRKQVPTRRIHERSASSTGLELRRARTAVTSSEHRYANSRRCIEQVRQPAIRVGWAASGSARNSGRSVTAEASCPAGTANTLQTVFVPRPLLRRVVGELRLSRSRLLANQSEPHNN